MPHRFWNALSVSVKVPKNMFFRFSKQGAYTGTLPETSKITMYRIHEVIMQGFLPAIQKNDMPAFITLYPIEISDGAVEPGERLVSIATSHGPYFAVHPFLHVIGVLAVSNVTGFIRPRSLPGHPSCIRANG